jgi:hypothetical protein
MSNTQQSQHLTFIAQTLAAAKALGLPDPQLDPSTESGLPENKGYVFIEYGPHGGAPAIIVPKSARGPAIVHSHLDLSDLEGHVALPRPNGRVVCHFKAEPVAVASALSRFCATGSSKRPVAAPVRRLTPASGQPVAPAHGQPVTRPTDVLRASSPAASVSLTDMFPGLADAPTDDAQVDEALAALEA